MEEPIIHVYVACPMNVPLDYLNEVCVLIRKLGGTPYYWDRNSRVYDTGIMDKAEVVVAISGRENAWRTNNIKIPKGTRSEIDRALQYQKPLFTTYIPQHGLQIYKAYREGNKDYDSFGGQSGSSGDFEYLILGLKNDKKAKMKEEVRIKANQYGNWVYEKFINVQSIPRIPGLSMVEEVSSNNPSVNDEYSYLTVEEQSKLLLITIK